MRVETSSDPRFKTLSNHHLGKMLISLTLAGITKIDVFVLLVSLLFRLVSKEEVSYGGTHMKFVGQEKMIGPLPKHCALSVIITTLPFYEDTKSVISKRKNLYFSSILR